MPGAASADNSLMKMVRVVTTVQYYLEKWRSSHTVLFGLEATNIFDQVVHAELRDVVGCIQGAE